MPRLNADSRHPVRFTLNGRPVAAEAEPRMLLTDFLRYELGATGTHVGCEHGVCGACTVLIDSEPARSCIALAVTLDGAAVRTLEGLADDPLMSTLKASFQEKHGLQCGFCTPGMLITSWDLLKRKGALSEAEIRVAMSGNLCRCTGYQGIVRSIKAAADQCPAAAQEAAR